MDDPCGRTANFGIDDGERAISVQPTDPVFVRAQALVSDGNGAAGRALIDSVIATTPTALPCIRRRCSGAHHWPPTPLMRRATISHIVVDYPLAPQAEDALLRLAQLELARGDRDGALTHLQRIQRDYPRSKSLARASYWTARVLFEKNDVPNACAANAKAMAQADSGEIELRNQIQYQGQRCPSVATASTVASPMASPPASPPPAVSAPDPVVATPPQKISCTCPGQRYETEHRRS